jgi:hypothetical protein
MGEAADLLLATQGVGPLLQRDYWAVIRNCRFTPVQVAQTVRRFFPSFPPEELVVFSTPDGSEPRLDVGDELDVRILGVPRVRVRVTHADAQSFTLATEPGHPEAGRITFGAYRNRRGDVIFHIRSHARSSGLFTRAGFLATGEVMQTSTWSDFVDRVAEAFGDGVIGWIHAITTPCADEEPEVSRHAPTYEARGG